MRRLPLLLALLLPLTAAAQTVETLPTTRPGQLMHALVAESRMEELRWPDFSDYRKHLRNFYAPNGWRLFWSNEGRVTPQARAVIALFEAADAKGINATDYDAGRWASRLATLAVTPNETDLARFDLAVTATLMRYISDLHIGRINPVNIEFDLDIETKKYYLPKIVGEIAASPDPEGMLAGVEPQYAEYRRLQSALAIYRRIAVEAEKEILLPVVDKVQAGDAYPALVQLARMLKRFGDLPADAKVDNAKYGGALLDAVKRFQARHGLDPDGVIAKKTFAELNTPVTYRVKQIQWALERWRWAPLNFDTPPIVVNVPEFRLRAYEAGGKVGLTMRVVVGQAYKHETPVFRGEMRYLVFRPYWSVPPSIQRGEIAPKLQGNREFLARNNYEVVTPSGEVLGATVDDETLRRLRSVELRVRQKPGPSNALGLVKFMFPNQNNVYLHSTPSQTLFARSRRDFSHGCIRVEDPVALAAWVLRDQPEWSPESIRAAMTGKVDDVRVNLLQSLPVMIIYTTVVVLETGEIRFFDDIYGHDETLENALDAGYPYPA